MESDQLEPFFRRVYGGKRWILGLEVAQGATGTCRRLAQWGCPRPVVIGVRSGVGPLPDPAIAELHLLGLPPMEMMEGIHAAEDALRDLPAEVQAAVDRFDPGREALALGVFFSDGRPIAGRRFFGARPASWRRLEDKVVVDALWDAAGVPRAPSVVVPLAGGDPASVHASLDAGLGTVWAGDAGRGFHGGATFTCRVRAADELPRALAHLARRCTSARVMPFLEGIPCSAHGVVFPDHVVVLRPAEMVVLRGGPGGFLYCRGGTCWDPPAERREELRAVVRRVGEHLRRTLGFRGAFTVDGVMTDRGFRPTELNPRVGAALGMMKADLPFQLLSDALVEGSVPELDPVALEAELLAHADANRVGSLGITYAAAGVPTLDVPVRLVDGAWVDDPDPAPEARAVVGPGVSGGYGNLTLLRPPVGESLGPRAVAFAAWLERHAGASFGPVEAAVDVSAPGR
jgi:hypothetical protein